MGDIHLLPSVKLAPRADIADGLRKLADRAENGEIDSLVLVAIGSSIFEFLATPELYFYEMLGAVELMKFKIIERKPDGLEMEEHDAPA